jgi:hypothetical protein
VAALSVDALWKKIDAQPSLRNFLLFEILDQILTEKELKWSFDVALANLSKLESVTSRLPSVKKLNVVLNSEAAELPVTGLLSQRMIFLSERQARAEAAAAYREYRSQVTAMIGGVSVCAAVRKSQRLGNVLTAFTITKSGKAASIFVNEKQPTTEKALCDCIRAKLATSQFGPPPGGQDLSIVYTFRFAGPTKVEF